MGTKRKTPVIELKKKTNLYTILYAVKNKKVIYFRFDGAWRLKPKEDFNIKMYYWSDGSLTTVRGKKRHIKIFIDAAERKCSKLFQSMDTTLISSSKNDVRTKTDVIVNMEI